MVLDNMGSGTVRSMLYHYINNNAKVRNERDLLLWSDLFGSGKKERHLHSENDAVGVQRRLRCC